MLRSTLSASTRALTINFPKRVVSQLPSTCLRASTRANQVVLRPSRLAFSTFSALQNDYRNRRSRFGDSGESDAPTPRVEHSGGGGGGTSIFVGNMPYVTTEQDIMDYLVNFNPKQAAIITGQDGMGRGFAFVDFPTPEDARAVVEQHAARPMVYLGRNLRVELSDRPFQRSAKAPGSGWGGDRRNNAPGKKSTSTPTTTLFVGNTPWSIEESELRQMFGPYGEIVTVRIAKTFDQRPRGFAHIDYTTVDAVQSIITAAESETFALAGRPLLLDFAAAPSSAKLMPTNRLYFRGLLNATLEGFKERVQELGLEPVAVTRLKHTDSGEPLSAGFIEFTSIAEATQALETLKGVTLEGDVIETEFARSKPNQPFLHAGTHGRS